MDGHAKRRDDERTVAGGRRRMRRADREVTDPEAVGAIIARCDIVDMAYVDAEGLTVVPLNFGYDYDADAGRLTLWMHSAPRGRKIDAIRAAGNRLGVAFAMRADCEVTEGRTACNWGEAFTSVVGTGVASIVDDLDEARHGLQTLMDHQAHMPHVAFTDAQVKAVTVWKIETECITAKSRPKPQAHAVGRGPRTHEGTGRESTQATIAGKATQS